MLHLLNVVLLAGWQTVLATWQILGEMSPFLLLGFGLAGLLSIWISPEWTERNLGGSGFGPVVRATLFGIPLPLCSCSVIPVVVSMRRHGASRAAATSFLLSTPQTGIDSIAITYALLGPAFAIFRPIAAIISGLLGGLMVLLFGFDPAHNDDPSASLRCTDSCCSHDGPKSLWKRALRHGFVTLPRDIAVPLLFGALLAGAMTALWPAPFQLKAYLGTGWLSILLLMVAAIPVYVCATASVPVAAGLIHLGAPPGAALAFLIVGAATNPAAVATVWKVLGRRTTILYLLTVFATAILCACLLNLVPSSWIGASASAACLDCNAPIALTSSLWAGALLAILGSSLVPWKKLTKQYGSSGENALASKTEEMHHHGECCQPKTLHVLGRLHE